MALLNRWEAAKSRYDAAAKQNGKDRDAVQKQIDKLTSEGEKQLKKLKAKDKFDSFLRDPVLTRMQAPELKPVIDKIRAKQKELDALKDIQERKSVGCTPAFKDVDKVLEVGARLKAGGVDDAGKWASWHKAAVSSLKKCAVAEKKFEKWMGNSYGSNQAAKDFNDDFKKIMREMSDTGGPIMRHAGTILKPA